MNDGDVKVDARIIDVKLGEAGTGNPQLGIAFETEDPEIRRVTGYLFFSDATLERTEKTLTDLGWAPAAHDWDIESMIADRVLLGVECSLVCVQDFHNDRARWKVKFINGKSSMMKKTYDATEVASFSQRLRAKMRAGGVPVKEPQTRRAAPAPRTTAPAPQRTAMPTQHERIPGVDTDDDGIPF